MEKISLDQIKSVKHPCSEDVETTISWTKNEARATIYTSDNATLNKLKKIIPKNIEEWEIFEAPRDSKGEVTGYMFKAPRKAISFRSGSFNMSEENMEIKKRTIEENRKNRSKVVH